MMVDSWVLSLLTTRNSISPLRSSILAFAGYPRSCQHHSYLYSSAPHLACMTSSGWVQLGGIVWVGEAQTRTLLIRLQPLGLLLLNHNILFPLSWFRRFNPLPLTSSVLLRPVPTRFRFPLDCTSNLISSTACSISWLYLVRTHLGREAYTRF